jgi:PleD family two-component response regulator
VILPGTGSARALGELDELRERIVDVPQRTGEGEFFVTISGGIAAFPSCGEAGTLISAAEGALEWAKRAGRNRDFTTET